MEPAAGAIVAMNPMSESRKGVVSQRSAIVHPAREAVIVPPHGIGAEVPQKRQPIRRREPS
jgi:hypothetical protein